MFQNILIDVQNLNIEKKKKGTRYFVSSQGKLLYDNIFIYRHTHLAQEKT